MKLCTLAALVKKILNSSSTSSSSRHRHKSRIFSSSVEEDENEDGISDNPSQFHKKRKRIDENEVKLLQIENNYSKKIVRNGVSTASSESDSESSPPSSSSAVSTSEDAIYGEEVEPEFDLMQSMLRESYSKE